MTVLSQSYLFVTLVTGQKPFLSILGTGFVILIILVKALFNVRDNIFIGFLAISLYYNKYSLDSLYSTHLKSAQYSLLKDTKRAKLFLTDLGFSTGNTIYITVNKKAYI